MAVSDAAGINALVQAIAKALALPETEVVAAFEADAISVRFVMDDAGKRLIEVTLGEQSARIGAGA